MLTPSNRTITITPGGTALVGRTTAIGGGGGGGSGTPAWLANMAIGEFRDIPGTDTAAVGGNLSEFSGWALVGTKLIAPLCGGHHVADNRTLGIDLSLDAPSWSILNPSSSSADFVTASKYYLDGKPTSRHVRNLAKWSAVLQRVMMLGAHDVYNPGAGALPSVDGFNLVTNQWDAAGTYADVINPATVTGMACQAPDGSFWANGCRFDPSTGAHGTWTQPALTQPAWVPRYPWALAQQRNLMFGLCYGSGIGGDGTFYGDNGIVAVKQVGNVQTTITINPSAAKTQFIADTPLEAGMDYDPVKDEFLFYCGGVGSSSAVPGRIYRIKPNNTNNWDMEIVSLGAGSVTMLVADGGVQSKWTYIPEYKGFVHLSKSGQVSNTNLQFLKTA